MMTENQWTSVPGSVPVSSGTETSESPASGKADAAKDEAAGVAGQVAESAQGVARTAMDEVANVASEAKSSARDLLDQAKSGFSSQAGTQQQKAAEGIRTVSGQLQSMADAPEQQGVASDLIRQAAQRSEAVATWLENREPGDLLGEVQRFARNRPGTFLLLAAGAGVLAGRLTRSLTAGAPSSQSADAPAAQTARPPVTEAVVVPGIGEPFYDEPATAGTYGGGTTGYPDSTLASPLDSPRPVDEELWAGDRTAEDTLGDGRLAVDPPVSDPLRRDRRAGGEPGGL